MHKLGKEDRSKLGRKDRGIRDEKGLVNPKRSEMKRKLSLKRLNIGRLNTLSWKAIPKGYNPRSDPKLSNVRVAVQKSKPEVVSTCTEVGKKFKSWEMVAN